MALLPATIFALFTAILWRDVSGVVHSDLPRLEIKGTNFEIGFRIGLEFQHEIMTAIRSNTFFVERILPYNKTAEGSALYSKYLSAADSSFPQYVDEIVGMSEGANMSFSELFLWNIRFELQLLLEPRVNKLPPPSCSDFYLAFGENETLMGHNEDGALIANTTSYIVSAEVISEDGDRFTAFCYAGELCGSAFGYSDTAGKVFSSNAVFPKNINTNAVGRNFLNRALIAEKFQFVDKLLRLYPCSSGFSYNVGTLDGKNVVNFEVSPSGVVATVIKGYGYHFNMYLHSNVAQYSDPSSLHRLARVKQLPQPANSSNILDLLGDTNDPDYPIYRTASGPDTAATLATALFDLPRSVFYIYRGNPALAEGPMMTMQMKQKRSPDRFTEHT